MIETTIGAFLDQLRAELRARGCPVERVAAEAEDHLLELVKRLRAEGRDEADAQREALARFGPAEEIARRYAEEVPRPFLLEARMTKAITRGLAALTSACAVFIAAHSLFFDSEGGAGWVTVKVLQSLAVIAVAALTLRRSWKPDAGAGAPLLVGAMWLQVSGGAGFAWTLHLASVTGDLEAWALAVCLALVAQGALIVWGLWRQRVTAF